MHAICRRIRMVRAASRPGPLAPVVFAKDGEVFANSRDVAAFFERRHDDVLRTIDSLISQEPNLRLRNFAESFLKARSALHCSASGLPAK